MNKILFSPHSLFELRPLAGRCVLASSLILIPGCATVPVTGRSQLQVISESELVGMADGQFSSLMDAANRTKAVLSAAESPQAAAALTTVRRVSDRIIDASGLRGRYNWETVVVKSKVPNAFVMPNGKIVVFTGILPVAKTEAGLAAVLGHEVGHVIAHHQAERVSLALLARATLSATDVALASRDSKYRPAIGAALGLGAQYGVLLPFSRLHESEADHIGLLLMAKAGYDPSEAIDFWERMEATQGTGPWEFLSTHPSAPTRSAQVRTWLPEANLYYADRTRPLPKTLTEVKAALAERSSATALAPIATQPPAQIGFWYRTKVSNRTTSVTYRFARKEACEAGECIVVESDIGATSIVTTERALVKITNPDGSWTRFSPPLRVVQWPIRVGETWSQPVAIEQSSGRRQSGQLKATVVDYEPVTVPAGTFLAYKIIVSVNGVRFLESWYAPEARVSVRANAWPSSGQITTELIDYEKRNDAVSPIEPD